MSEARTPLGKVLVAGAGQVGVLAAIALKRAVPAAEVIVLGTTPEPGALADRATTALPFANRLHDRLGIAEADIVAQADGSHRLVTRYFGWGGAGQTGTMPYGADIAPALTTRFAQEWGGGGRGAASDMPVGSLAEVLANAGRFAVPPDHALTPLSEVDYALRWNVAKYHALVVSTAQELGVSHVQGDLAGFHSNGTGGIAAVEVAGAGRIEADLFLDCTGPSAQLLSRLPGFALDEWSDRLPLRRLIFAKPQQGMHALEDRFSLLPEGWIAEIAGRDALQVVLGVAEGVPEADALRALAAPPLVGFALEPSSARECWLGNVIALGDAAARFEPLGHLNLDLAHRQIDLLLEMLPGQFVEVSERAEYNRRSALMMAALRDTLALHYHAPAARTVFGASEPSAELAGAIDQFTRRGRIPFREEAPLLGQEMQALAGALGFARGIMPQARALRAEGSPQEEAAFADKARAAIGFAPPYAEWIRSQVPV